MTFRYSGDVFQHKYAFCLGYYCPGGSSIDTDTICPIGKYCPEGSAEPQDCPPASYVDYEGAWECTLCPERKYINVQIFRTWILIELYSCGKLSNLIRGLLNLTQQVITVIQTVW